MFYAQAADAHFVCALRDHIIDGPEQSRGIAAASSIQPELDECKPAEPDNADGSSTLAESFHNGAECAAAFESNAGST